MSNTDQVSVPLPAELREYVRQVADVEERSQGRGDPATGCRGGA